MTVANRVVRVILASPAHRLLSGSTDVVRYRGRRTGATHETPTQYARLDEGLVILVGTPGKKTWWRNFRAERDLDVLVRGEWLPMVGRAVVGAEDPDAVAPLLDAYLARFPKTARLFGGATGSERDRQAVVVHCQPR
ncbi:MAG: nitroreductase/quinone reductase family protein [Microthrixaceae bacterium]